MNFTNYAEGQDGVCVTKAVGSSVSVSGRNHRRRSLSFVIDLRELFAGAIGGALDLRMLRQHCRDLSRHSPDPECRPRRVELRRDKALFPYQCNKHRK